MKDTAGDEPGSDDVTADVQPVDHPEGPGTESDDPAGTPRERRDRYQPL